MSTTADTVSGLLEAVQIDSSTSFSWYGEPASGLPAEVAEAMDLETARAYLRHALQNHLYGSFYCTGAATRSRPAGGYQQFVRWTPFLESLSSANTGTGSRDPGWLIDREEADGRVVVSRGGLRLWARRDEVFGRLVEAGATVSVLMPKELLRLSPGFYLALGDPEFAQESEAIVRLYWHLRSETAEALVGAASSLLNSADLPFRLKVISDPSAYTRCDAGVLYVRRADTDRVLPIVARIHARLRNGLRETTPALTKRLADGLGLAEQPPSAADSFGMHRCGLLAEAMIAAFERRLSDPNDRLEAVREQFAKHGLSLEAPHLNAGSSDDYVLAV
jgi:hypothetical protein